MVIRKAHNSNIQKNEKLYPISVSKLFNDENFLIPIYQRNYAWQEAEINQMLEDIDSSISSNSGETSYFLGNLILNKELKFSEDEGTVQISEVIDGQQRLTTLYLLAVYLDLNFDKKALRFEAREQSNCSLNWFFDNKGQLDKNFLSISDSKSDSKHLSEELLNGYRIISNYFEKENIDKKEFKNKLDQVKLILVQVPEDVDLNHYFEIMNTRGEQLELHEIAKARIINEIQSDQDRKIAADIWDACSDMDSYVQMNFKKPIRDKIFDNNWNQLNEGISSFEDLSNLLGRDESISEKRSLLDIIENRNEGGKDDGLRSSDEDEGERFESIISFTYFLLHVNAVIRSSQEDDSNLDDKNLLINLEWIWKEAGSENSGQVEGRAKDFIYNLLKSRIIFDRAIIKRENLNQAYSEGKWSLQRMQKYGDKSKAKQNYRSTLESEDKIKKLRSLQSSLRITYTSPKTMHWISLVIKSILKDGKSEEELIVILEKYCRDKIRDSNYKEKTGFAIDRIVFTYLDYLLYRDGYSINGVEIIKPLSNWQFQFRNSIEHFFPQNPIGAEEWPEKDLNSFGNLALISVASNLLISNRIPAEKASVKAIINQSLKLQIMAYITSNSIHGWNKKASADHGSAMFAILDKDLKE